jgi:hypothetical protein
MLFQLSTFACFTLITTTSAYVRAQRGVQVLDTRNVYQGGWPLALAGSASTTCPSDASTMCGTDNGEVNPSCCPSGQTCTTRGWEYYCCPTSMSLLLRHFIPSNTKLAADCNTAVTNFPACANMTWNMFINNGEGGYFCCEPSQIGVNPSSGGGICENSDQVVPTSLLATIVSQVGAPTPTPTGTSATSATTTGGSPVETNPTVQNTPQPTNGINSTISNMSLGVKIAIGVGCVVFVVLVVCGGNLIRRRTYVRANTYEYDTTYNAGYSAYRSGYVNPMRQDNGNHVTVNVVHGDQTTLAGFVLWVYIRRPGAYHVIHIEYYRMNINEHDQTSIFCMTFWVLV